MVNSPTPFAEKVEMAIKKSGLKIYGVSIGRKYDKTTWRVDFSEYREGDDKIVKDVFDSFDIEKAMKNS